MKTRKNITGPHASVHFKNGQNAKSAHENEKNVVQDRMPLCFENGQNAKNDLKSTNAKNAHVSEKKHNRTTCFGVFRKWVYCQKRS